MIWILLLYFFLDVRSVVDDPRGWWLRYGKDPNVGPFMCMNFLVGCDSKDQEPRTGFPRLAGIVCYLFVFSKRVALIERVSIDEVMILSHLHSAYIQNKMIPLASMFLDENQCRQN